MHKKSFKINSISYALQIDNIYVTHQPLEFETQCSECVLWVIFSVCGAIGRLLIDKLTWCSCMRIRDDF